MYGHKRPGGRRYPISVLKPDPTKLLPLSYVEYHVLLSLKGRALHGYGVIKDVEERTSGQVSLAAGTLYGALNRLAEQGLVAEAPGGEEDAVHPGRPRRRYRLTRFGERVLEAEVGRMAELLEMARAKNVTGVRPEPAPGTTPR